MHLPLYPLVQVVPVSLLGPQDPSLQEALEDQVSHKLLCPPVKHDNIRRQIIYSCSSACWTVREQYFLQTSGCRLTHNMQKYFNGFKLQV